ncbi:MAG: hypothetical protein AAF674_19735 [Pseudomonadota bacterium]
MALALVTLMAGFKFGEAHNEREHERGLSSHALLEFQIAELEAQLDARQARGPATRMQACEVFFDHARTILWREEVDFQGDAQEALDAVLPQ